MFIPEVSGNTYMCHIHFGGDFKCLTRLNIKMLLNSTIPQLISCGENTLHKDD